MITNLLTAYNGDVKIAFSEAGHRYQVSERDGDSWSKPRKVVGVSTILNTLNKPALLLWPQREALKSLGAKLVCVDQVKQKFEWRLDGEKVIVQEDIILASKAHLLKSDAGKDIGREVHKLVEQFLNDEPYSEDFASVSYKAAENFAKWYNERKFKKLETEKVVYSRKLEVAGTLDAILELDGKIILVDFKTSNTSSDAPQGVYPENMLQMGAYSLAYREETGKPIDNLMVVNISKKDGKIRTLSASDLGVSVEDCEQGFKNLLEVYRLHNKLSNYIKGRK